VSRPRVLLADDHCLVADGLRSLLVAEFDVVGVVEDGAELVAAALELEPDVIVADITMPRLNGFEALAQLKREGRDIPVVFLTMHTEAAYARRARAAGAAGFVVKHAAVGDLIAALRAALSGKTFVSPSLKGAVSGGRQRGARTEPGLSIPPRQREILELIAAGLSAKEIASMLCISTRTVEFHKAEMMEAWGIHNSAELVTFAIKNGIVKV